MTRITYDDSNFHFDVFTEAPINESDLHSLTDEYVGRWYNAEEYPEAECATTGEWVIECFAKEIGIEVDVDNWEE